MFGAGISSTQRGLRRAVGATPSRWNQGAHVFEFPDNDHCPINPAEFSQMRDRPALIHFTTEFKPWKFPPFPPSSVKNSMRVSTKQHGRDGGLSGLTSASNAGGI